MKYLVVSDIHGALSGAEAIKNAYDFHTPDYILCLGDILYHGPRNDLPKDYAPKQVIAMLNPLKNEIMCVRGNCDTEVDQMVLDFNVLCEQACMYVNDKSLVMVHGHKLDEKNMPAIKDGDYLVCGHTHIPKCEKREGYTYINPGSVSIPKEDSAHSYIILEDKFYWKDLDGNVYMQE